MRLLLPCPRKRGDVRSDGLVFYSYSHAGKYECWITSQRLQEIRERGRQLDAVAREKNRAKCMAWRLSNLEAVRAKDRERAQKNRHKKKKQYAAWRSENIEKKRATDRKWQAANLDRVYLKKNERRAKKRGTKVFLTPAQRKVVCAIYSAARRVSSCIKINHHVDHIIPIVAGGHHAPSNLQILPAKINLRKGARL